MKSFCCNGQDTTHREGNDIFYACSNGNVTMQFKRYELCLIWRYCVCVGTGFFQPWGVIIIVCHKPCSNRNVTTQFKHYEFCLIWRYWVCVGTGFFQPWGVIIIVCHKPWSPSLSARAALTNTGPICWLLLAGGCVGCVVCDITTFISGKQATFRFLSQNFR